MVLDPKVQRIIAWRKCLATLPDDDFFDIIRMYLGEVQTPYNKQNLIEDLSAFLRKDENKAAIIRLLTPEDLRVIAAVRFISNITLEKLAEFFALPSFSELYTHVANLKQRLLIYEDREEKSEKKFLHITPLLEDSLEQVLTLEQLLPTAVVQEEYETVPPVVSSQLIAAFVSYILGHPECCKGDGIIKRRNSPELQKIFGDLSVLQVLVKAFISLGLFKEENFKLVINWDYWSTFSSLQEDMQYAYICAAASGKFSRSTLRTHAQLLFDVVSNIPPQGCTKDMILKLAFLVKENSGSDLREWSRFSQIMANASSQQTIDADVMSTMIDVCMSLGLLYACATDKSGAAVLRVSSGFAPLKAPAPAARKSFLTIDAGFSVTIMPGLKLESYLPLIKFLNVISCDTAGVFEITKQSAMRAFDVGHTPESILKEMGKYCSYELPQNLEVSLQEWYASFSSAALYHGYVLKVPPENEQKIRRNPRISHYIDEVLAPGIFLLHFANDEEARMIVARGGMDFIGRVRSAPERRDLLAFLPLHETKRDSLFAQKDDGGVQKQGDGQEPSVTFKLSSEEEQEQFLQGLKDSVRAMNIPADQKEGLLNRVEKRIVVNPVQLRGSSVRFEKLEAIGMDYQGKLHIVETAIQIESRVEVEIDHGAKVLVGRPKSLSKKEGDADVVLVLPDGSTQKLSICKILRIKRIKE